MKKYYSLLMGLLLLIFGGCSRQSKKIDLNNYQPAEEFQPAFQALTSNDDVEHYDIESTVRIINALEIAQSQSGNFQDFLEYMAKQDYSLVAKDVIDAKTKLFPILQRMFQLEKEYEELSNIWILAKSAATGVKEMAKNSSPMGFGLAILDFVSGDFSTGDASMNIAKNAAFKQYEEEMELKGQIKDEIEVLETAYLEYLSYFLPIYTKYMKEWDKLCLNKDKAYLDLYSGRYVDAYNSISTILKKYPQNREALLLKSLALINLSSYSQNNSQTDNSVLQIRKELNLPDSVSSKGWDSFLLEADLTLTHYVDLYPNYSAPALVLKGLLSYHLGKEQQALSFFDQAALEYPRQAAELTDLLDSYRNRTYLNKTPEGLYLLKLYRSTMEGYGMFSPNLLKAHYYAQKGLIKESENEIYNHFFRRGNQGIYDCLLSDMQFCEKNLYNSFSQLLVEHSYIDINVEPAKDWKFSSKDNEITVSLYNRSDINLENVRVFLCIHYTDMYKDEYDVVKLPMTKNIIKSYEKIDLGTVILNYEDKKYQDITRIRAIAMTDEKICWIDDASYKMNFVSHIKSEQGNNIKADWATNSSKHELGLETLKRDLMKKTKFYLLEKKKEVSQSNQSFMSKVKDAGASLIDLWNKSDNGLKIELPRSLVFVEPVFSINQIQEKDKAILPEENFLAGEFIRLKFDYIPSKNSEFPLYVYSRYINFKINIAYSDNGLSIKDIQTL